MNELSLACKKLDLLIRAGLDLDRQKAVSRAWSAMGKSTFKSRVMRQKINSLKKAK